MVHIFAMVIAIVAVVMTFSIPLSAIYGAHRKQMLIHEERRLMVEKGMVPPPLPVEKMPWETKPGGTKAALEACLRRGVIMVFLGIGLGIGSLLLPDQLGPVGDMVLPDRLNSGLAVAGVIIGLTGLGNLTYYAIAQRRKPEDVGGELES